MERDRERDENEQQHRGDPRSQPMDRGEQPHRSGQQESHDDRNRRQEGNQPKKKK